MTRRLLLLLALLAMGLTTGCPSEGDDDDATGDDDDATGDDDDSTADDDDSTADDDDSTADDDDSAGDDDDSAGDDDDSAGDDDDSAPAVILGAWLDNWGGTHGVTPAGWLTLGAPNSRFDTTEFDGDAGWLVAQNGAANTYNPGLWSRFQWTVAAGGALHYCQVAYDAATEAAALSATPANASDLVSGCGGIGWSSLAESPGLPIIGVWIDEWSTDNVIDDATWTMGVDLGASKFHLAQFGEGWVVAQNDALNAWSPSLWSRFDWTWSDGALYHCQTAYDAIDEAAAVAVPAADATNPSSAGCGGFAWTRLSP